MPELPEVHTIVQGLRPRLEGTRIFKAEVTPNYPKIKDRDRFEKALSDKKIIQVARLAKNLLFKLDSPLTLRVHLGMTGRLLLSEQPYPDKWVRVVFTLANGKYLVFSDIRKFGRIELLTEQELTRLSQSYGVEPVDPRAKADQLQARVGKKKGPVKNVLLDQGVISGLGNIYATEALFEAKISPHTPAQELSSKQWEVLFEAAKKVLTAGIKNRGTTLGDRRYADEKGEPGKFQNHLLVYAQKQCNVCGSKIVYTKISGRGTYHCPTCQK